MININILSKEAIANKVETALKTPVKTLPIKPDIFTMTPSVKANVKQQIKKFDNPTFIQKANRFLTKSKIGRAIMFGAAAVIAFITGKKIADDIEEKVQ